MTIKEPYSVRWLGLKNAVHAEYESYSSVLTTFSSFVEESATAKCLFQYFSDYKVVLLDSLMLDVHECLGIFSEQLQLQNLCFSQIYPMLNATLGQLQHLETHDGEYMKAVKQSVKIKTEISRIWRILMMKSCQDILKKVPVTFHL